MLVKFLETFPYQGRALVRGQSYEFAESLAQYFIDQGIAQREEVKPPCGEPPRDKTPLASPTKQLAGAPENKALTPELVDKVYASVRQKAHG